MPEVVSTPSHERSDVSGRGAAWFAVSLVVGVALAGLFVWWMEVRLDHSGFVWPHQPTRADPQFQAPGPVLQTVPAGDLEALRAAEEKALQNCEWIDRNAGVIRIPVERAREVILKRGLPSTGTTMPLPGPRPAPGVNPSSQSPVLNLQKGGAP
jgi:hypothetical protein